MKQKMENTAIMNYPELLFRLTALKSEKESQEQELKLTVTEFLTTVDIISLLSRTNKPNTDIPQNLIKTGLKMVLNLITGLVFGKNRSIKGYLNTLVIERFTSMIIDNNLINIVAGIGSMLFKKRNQENHPE